MLDTKEQRIKIIQGNCIDKIKELENNSIDCVVSSPPYFGLRDYGTASYEGGDDNCKHTITDGVVDNKNNKLTERPNRASDKKHCVKCGAKRIDEQFGLEKTYQDYLANTVKVFETFKPKLKDTATIWWNVGDSYNNKPAGNKDLKKSSGLPNKKENLHKRKDNISKVLLKSLKEKDLLMIPNRVAIALQEAGWYIRSEIIWHKPNPMPESVKDRPTSCHEKIWLITKNKKYYYDAEAIKEPCKTFDKNIRDRDTTKLNNTPGRTKMGGLKKNNYIVKNKRNVWTVTTKPFKGAHFATFPKDLIEPCIKAGCPEGGVVLDPFGGSGTTGIVAALNNRNAILVELNPEYIKIAEDRIDKELGLFKQTNKGGK
jgi:DNA modification methylase